MRTSVDRSRKLPVTLSRDTGIPSSGQRADQSEGSSADCVTRDMANDSRRARFVTEFESWLFVEFRRALIAARSGAPDASELTSLMRPWIDELSGLDHQGILDSIGAAEAAKLLCVMNCALDGLERSYKSSRSSPAIMLLALSPVDDILALLSVRAQSAEFSDCARDGR